MLFPFANVQILFENTFTFERNIYKVNIFNMIFGNIFSFIITFFICISIKKDNKIISFCNVFSKILLQTKSCQLLLNMGSVRIFGRF